jgi:hypothetical protein
MTKRIKITSPLAKTVRVTSPKAPTVSPKLVAEKLGAEIVTNEEISQVIRLARARSRAKH